MLQHDKNFEALCNLDADCKRDIQLSAVSLLNFPTYLHFMELIGVVLPNFRNQITLNSGSTMKIERAATKFTELDQHSAVTNLTLDRCTLIQNFRNYSVTKLCIENCYIKYILNLNLFMKLSSLQLVGVHSEFEVSVCKVVLSELSVDHCLFKLYLSNAII